VIGGGDDQVCRAGAVAGGLKPVAIIDIAAVDDDAFSVQGGVLKIL